MLPTCTKIWVRVTDDFKAIQWANFNVNVRFVADNQTPNEIWEDSISRINNKIENDDWTYWSDLQVLA